MRRLVAALCKVYTDQASVLRIARDAGLDVTRIPLPQTATVAQAWTSVLVEAEARGLLPRIFTIARAEYPEVSELYEVEFQYLADRQRRIADIEPSAGADPRVMTMFGDIVAANVRLLKLEQNHVESTQRLAAMSENIAAIKAAIDQANTRSYEQRYTILLLIIVVSAITSFVIQAAIFAVG